MKTRKVLILGSGPAGLTAAIYTARAGVETVVWDGAAPGGALTTTPRVENFPGFPDGVDGVDLILRMRAQAEKWGAVFEGREAARVEAREGGGAKVWAAGEDGCTEWDALVVATGAVPRELGVERERELRGKGVSYCATCDGMFFRGKAVGVVGGGDSACEEAMHLAKLASKVTLIHRRDKLRASAVLAKRVAGEPKIEVKWNAVVAGLVEEGGKLAGVRLKDVRDGGESVLPLDGLFVAVGTEPASAALAGVVETDGRGYLLADGVRTRHPGIFVAGDVADGRYKQAVSAAGTGCRAGLEAARWLEELGEEG